VFPKRLARRSVTRGLLRRLARPVAESAQREVGEPLWWVLRLTAPIAREDFPSASSDPMRRQIRHEIQTCFRLAVEGWRRRSARGSAPGARAGADVGAGSCP
jgi:ribonuclease P protein component